MKKFFFSMLLCVAFIAQSQSIWNADHLSRVKQNIDKPYYSEAYSQLLSNADALLNVEPLSVMMKEKMPGSGDKHDYMSQARYYWPDPSKPDGLPYISRDGVSNPELNKLDRNRLGNTASRVITLSLAWYFSGDEKYAQKATQLLRAWFLDKDTKMNPNLEYAQMIPGRNNNKGRSFGLIDSYSFVEMLDAVALLEKSKSFTSKDSKQLKKWFGDLTEWMLSSPQGIEESNAANNHSVAYDTQIIAFLIYAGKIDEAKEIINSVPEKRIFTQIEPDGAQPHELRRTISFHYSHYNLVHFVDIMTMARKLGMDVDKKTSADGRNIYKAADYLTPYLGKNARQWEYQQLNGIDGTVQDLCQTLYRAATYLILPDANADDEMKSRAKKYLSIYRENRIYNPSDRFNLLFYDADAVDHAYAFAARQMEYAVDEANKARKNEGNAKKRKVMPRSIGKDGSLAMVGSHDWCSGFFPGSLWQLYNYTNDDAWRQTAISWTWPIEEAKWHKGTHDLGFMMNNSFGKAYDMTGEKSYKDVVLQSARTLISRYNPTVGSIRSWDHNRDKWKFPVIIDNMMNLEMLFRATELTGDSTYWNVAVNHANTTMKNHFRNDYSSYHVVDYDPETGEVRGKCTHQGYADDSYWSRGQGWGLYGFTMCYRFTGDEAYLKQGESIADFFLSLENLPDDGIPYWDMKMPSVSDCTSEKVNGEIPRDASSAAIIASGLYELCVYVAPEKGARYKAFADKIVDSLNNNYQAQPGTNYGFLLLHSTGHHPGGSEIDVPLNYADYYYLEALARKRQLENI
ncbi:MAG: alginate lyase family protein [Bacteroides sp.]|nr:alginate lyase family protein [Bacteroides sp.]MCM1391079.1 alginate lyase family protein [Bacteroides sp.]